MSSILGGGGGKQTSSQTSGYSALPPSLLNAFNGLGEGVAQYTNPNNPGVTDRFTPLAQTGDETNAFNQIRQGFAPTQQSLGNDISMLMNPFDQYVVDDVNRQAQGDFSILKQNANGYGQMGSNRQALGANDIEQTRLGTIGKLRQGQYNTALDQILNNIIPQRQQDAQGLLGIGQFERGLDTANKQAPISALQAGTGMISPFTAGGTQTSNQSTGGSGTLAGIGSLANGIGSAYLAFSDSKLKENIVPKGTENGHKVYEFSYKGEPERYIGVIAQEVMETHPEAVFETPRGLMVDYQAIGVDFREVHNGRS